MHHVGPGREIPLADALDYFEHMDDIKNDEARRIASNLLGGDS